ncbi:hypothetical protein CTI12_AA464060 [Artemisia annua]|uniref:Replication protein A 70 kDa DNA-binding subunit B/D first OB fold domain-containing protein n=1 Tax=Artemisia annua TaxID=35608 RepID=A0A2U1LQ06_ARTAN|nr:hypothetical protein CTI12_AA464060 [Artemisia annua]
MAVFVSGYINDLSAVKDNITLRVRVLRSWTQVIYNKPHVKNLEMILLDENNTKMQATCRMANVNQFKNKLVEGAAVKLERYSLGEIQPKYRMVNNALRLSFLSNTLSEFKEVEEYRLRLFSREDVEPSENTASRISAGSKFSTKDDFLNKYPVKNIVELLDVEKVQHTHCQQSLL